MGNIYNHNGVRVNADESQNSCKGCGSAITMVGQVRGYGDKWVYLNDWVVFGGYGTGNPGAISDLGSLGGSGSFPFGEGGIYVYGALDTSHGNYFANNLYGGKTPYRVQTGDCGNAGLGNYLNFKGNAGQNGNNNCDYCNAYAFCWVYTPSGSGQQWGVGSDDGVRIWQNGTLIHDNNAFRGTTWDEDRFKPTGMSAGWNRVLFKVHNGGGGFSGVISFHHGTDFNQMEPSVSLQGDRYGGYSVGYEQNDWYPRIDVASCYGASNPQPNDNVYGSNTTVTASGTASVTGPVPLWKVMHWEWGYGISEGNYADVSSGTTSWSHTQTGVTGHRRFHFFSVSRSGRTSRQNNGATGGDNWADGGAGNYVDVYVDNLAPQNPAFSSVTAASTSQIDLGWSIPLDQGVGITAGSTEAADESGAASSNHYRRGDVGVKVYRDGSTAVYDWGTGTSASDTALAANTAYTYTIEARDNTGQGRGAWANTTGQQGSTQVWTLSVPPTSGSVTPDNASPCAESAVTWTAAGGFGAGKVQKYKYAWSQSPTYTWTESEADWSGGTIQTTPTAAGTWYLHVKGYNGATPAVANGTYAYAVTANALPEVSAADRPRNQGASLKIRVSDLTPTPNTIQSVGNATGGTVSISSGYVFFLPDDPNALTTGSFSYTAANGFSCTKQATVNVTVVAQGGVAQTPTVPPSGPVTVSFAGIPDFPYQVERATNLDFSLGLRSWTTSAPAAGVFQVQDDFGDLGERPSSAWYRLEYNP